MIREQSGVALDYTGLDIVGAVPAVHHPSSLISTYKYIAVVRVSCSIADPFPYRRCRTDLVVSCTCQLMSRGQKTFGDSNTRFFQMDISSAIALPKAELVFSRQMTQHQCNSDVLKVLRLISSSGARFALLTNFDMRDKPFFTNTDIRCDSGDYRVQDLTRAPFALPQPLHFWSEFYPSNEKVGLGLWALPFP